MQDVEDEHTVANGENSEGKRVHLKRRLGLVSGTALIVGTMIGSGIFITPGGVLQRSGSVATSLLIWTGCGITSILASLAYIELGTIIPEQGGEYTYLLRAFGQLVGFLYSWMGSICIRPSSYAILAQAFATYAVEPFYQVDGQIKAGVKDDVELIKTIVTVALLIIICMINCLSVRLATFLQNSMTFAKLVALGLIILGGIYKLCKGRTEYLEYGFDRVNGTEFSLGSIALSFYSGLWAYDGWNQLNFATEEVENPMRNLPLAILIGVPSVMVLYLAAIISYLTLLSPVELYQSTAVAISWAGRFFSDSNPDLEYMDKYMPYVMTAFVAMSTCGAANGSLFASARFTFAAAREGHVPAVFSYVHVRSLTPVPSLCFNTLVSIIMVLLMDINTLIDFFSFSAWIFYGGCFLAVIIMRYTKKKIERPFKVWLVVPVVLCIMSVYLVVAPIIDNPAIEYVFVLVFIVVGVIVYFPFVHYKWRLPCLDAVYHAVMRMCCLSLSQKDVVSLVEE